ncbi:hypothetical protein [Occultella gossypii]|uniref:Uncharacterized protein n=1 Tax=Occultella gossypii TaxID=2800820 RepID=A0ABS7SB15_9MICO|nr:hypothetical protein [Occultella gossypii]MBZ2196448.1 hypothetical protein [Occultella gossypii]
MPAAPTPPEPTVEAAPQPRPITLPEGLQPRPVPSSAGIRVFIGPANHAGQGFQWARALERTAEDVSAVSFAPTREAGFSFEVDYTVPVGIYWDNEIWARDQLGYLTDSFTHVVFEAEQPLLGVFMREDFSTEARLLRDRGVHIATICHGSDIRLPSRHIQENPWSPFLVPGYRKTKELEVLARLNARRLAELEAPVFVSTPDLLDDLPSATWCPVVVEPRRWRAERPATHALPVVVHAPSRAEVKGTDLIEPTLEQLHAEGIIEYRRITKIPSAKMPAVYQAADIVLDQFRIGSYGVAACEAMAAGCVVLGNIRDSVREHVAQSTGLDVPIVQADPDTLSTVLRDLLDAREGWPTVAADGVNFVDQVHDGTRSAEVLGAFLGTSR